MERCLRGLKEHPAKMLTSKGVRGFESLLLRKKWKLMSEAYPIIFYFDYSILNY